jgi:trans-aconitate 2-methyltransferase
VTQDGTYAFGDTELARERLGIVADTFAPCTRQLLQDLPPREPRYILDVGCGPGYTTALLEEAFPRASITGLDASAAMVDEARTRSGQASFIVADVTAPLRLPADIVYCRLLLGHLPEPRAAVAMWVQALRAPGMLVCEEPVRYRSEDAAFARYEELVTAVVAQRGSTLWAGPVLDEDPPGCRRELDRVIEHRVRVGRAAAMFWRNAATFAHDDPEVAELIRDFQAMEANDPADNVMWEIRQTVWSKRASPR